MKLPTPYKVSDSLSLNHAMHCHVCYCYEFEAI